ncbi:radical SAM protein [Fusobacterium sp. PH5-44]|uniref:radical SAM protein n=1 Tax=unclassified Fusobacterium TaxID=2648384 RepID=UPI003D1D50B1
MKTRIKKVIYSNKKFTKIFELLKLFLKSNIFTVTGKSRKYPKVLQFPITTLCNSRCVMCSIPEVKFEKEIDFLSLNMILADEIYRKIEYVGINGGEPFLKKDLINIVKSILNLPKIKGLNIITNGFNPTLIHESLKIIYEECKKVNVNFHVSVSLDGYGEIHDVVRGVSGCFNNVLKTIDILSTGEGILCDNYDVACTIVKQNIYNVVELKEYCKSKKIPIKFRLGIKNKRISSEKKYCDFSVLEDFKTIQTAKEIFYTLYSESKGLFDKYRYWSIYDFLAYLPSSERKLGCMWQEEGITLDSHGDVFYCAVESDVLGNSLLKSSKELFFDNKNINYRKNIVKNNCNKCIHDYAGNPKTKDIIRFIKYILVEDREWGKSFKKELKN